MKPATLLILLVLALAGPAPVDSQTRIYTWTDPKGRIHLTDEPPPPEAVVREIIDTEPLTPAAEAAELQLRKQRQQARREEQQRRETAELTRRARQADEQAREAVRRAEEQIQQAIETRKRFGNTPSRREQFKYKIRAEDEKAVRLQEEAQRAVQEANALAEEARARAARPEPPRP
ncbi:MAG: DUF4124 domain-containing protein [Desulfobacterales bacterium]|nr:DUF4124 domain-containing protein [Desulfobacterales bacterium]